MTNMEYVAQTVSRLFCYWCIVGVLRVNGNVKCEFIQHILITKVYTGKFSSFFVVSVFTHYVYVENKTPTYIIIFITENDL